MILDQVDFSISIDFFVVPTVTFRLLYCLIFFDHERRKVIHFGVTSSPNSNWIKLQIREAFPFEYKFKYLIRDNDRKYSQSVKDFIKACELIDTPTAFRCPWQNPFCERMIGNIRSEILNYVIILGAYHLKNILGSYFEYYHNDRTHVGLAKDSPNGREITHRSSKTARVVGVDRVGGLYRKYEWAEAS